MELLLWVLSREDAVGYCVAHGLVDILTTRLLAHANALLALQETLAPLLPSTTDTSASASPEHGHACTMLMQVVARVATQPLGRRRLRDPAALQRSLAVLASLQVLQVAASKDSADAAAVMQRTLRDGVAAETMCAYAAAAARPLLRAWEQGSDRLAEQLLVETCWAMGASDPPQCQLLLCKAPTQEEFIRGSMGSSAYGSKELGTTMRDVKNFICTKLDMAGLVDDDFGMELLVGGRIVALGLAIADLYQHLGTAGPMVVTYRLKGLDGDATEPFLETLDGAKEVGEERRDKALADALDVDTLLALMERVFSSSPPTTSALCRLLAVALSGAADKGAVVARAHFARLVEHLATDSSSHHHQQVLLLQALARHVPADAPWPSTVHLLSVGAALSPVVDHVMQTMPDDCKTALATLLEGTPLTADALQPFITLAPALRTNSGPLSKRLTESLLQDLPTPDHAAVCQLLAAMQPRVEVSEELVQRLHALEQTEAAATQLLEGLSNSSPSAASAIAALRAQTSSAERARAARRKAAALASLATTTVEFLEEELEEEECACLVCREGYLQSPGALLGVYAQRARDDGVTSHMRPIHVACHAAAQRADAALRAPKSEWEGAALRNGNVPCNCIVPLFDASVDGDEYAQAVARLGGGMWRMARAVHRDGNDQLLVFVMCAAMHGSGDEGGSGGDEGGSGGDARGSSGDARGSGGDARWQQALEAARQVRAGQLTCEELWMRGDALG